MAAASSASGAVEDPRGIYVGGLPKHAEWQELKDHMKHLGGEDAFVAHHEVEWFH